MIAAFAAADQLRRRPAPVNTSMRRTGSGIGLCSEIDMCRSPRVGFEHHPSDARPKGVAQTPLTEQQTLDPIDMRYALGRQHLPLPADPAAIFVIGCWDL